MSIAVFENFKLIGEKAGATRGPRPPETLVPLPNGTSKIVPVRVCIRPPRRTGLTEHYAVVAIVAAAGEDSNAVNRESSGIATDKDAQIVPTRRAMDASRRDLWVYSAIPVGTLLV